MSIADEARAEAERRFVIMSTWDESQSWRQEAFIAGAEWQASRKPEAAPSDTDRERLAKVIMDALDSLWVSDDRVLGKLHARDEILAAGFSRTSQPVQVEVTDDMVEKAAKAMASADGLLWVRLGELTRNEYRDDARAALTTALGGGE